MFRALTNWLGFGSQPSTAPPPFSEKWREFLHRRVWQYKHLRSEQRIRVDDVVAHMVAERRWTGGSGYVVTDEMQVVVSGIAALMTLGMEEPYYFHRVPEIILYPKAFFATRDQSVYWNAHPIFGTNNQPRLGEAWYRGPIILSWDSICRPYDGSNWHTNVVIHEFTHHLDGLDGDMSGTPPLSDAEEESEWYRVTELDYLQLVGEAERGEPSLLSHYGATNRVEFFAVATECFFERPHDLREQHAHLYEVLSNFFRQSPADYLPRERQPPLRKAGTSQRRKATPQRLNPAVAGDPFARGLMEYNEGDLQAAIGSFSKALSDDPEDGEAFTARAMAYLDQQRYADALRDADRALELDPYDNDALAVRGCAQVLRGEFSEGMVSLKQIDPSADSSRARAHLGYAYFQQNKPKQALHELSIALAMDPYNAQIFHWRAAVYRQIGDTHRAELDESKAARLDPIS